jgi:hypothetical protein
MLTEDAKEGNCTACTGEENPTTEALGLELL